MRSLSYLGAVASIISFFILVDPPAVSSFSCNQPANRIRATTTTTNNLRILTQLFRQKATIFEMAGNNNVSSGDTTGTTSARPKRDDGTAAVKARKLYTYAEARKKARTYGFITQDEFIEYECAGTYQLPKNIDEVWSEEWTNWDDFLGVPLSYDVAKEVVQQVLVKERGVNSEETYMALIKSGGISDDELASRLPLRPDLYYKSVWISWDDFLGSGTAIPASTTS